MLMLCLCSSKAFCQRMLIDGSSSDTTICFTLPQSKFLLKQYYAREECNKLLSIYLHENDALTELVSLRDSIISRQDAMLNGFETIVQAKNGTIRELEINLGISRTEAERQKTLKVAYLLGGGLLSGTLGFILLNQ